jgi:DNA-binding MarR family transcriptional regulator
MAGQLDDRDYEALARFRVALRSFLAFSESECRAAGVTTQQYQLLLAVRGYDGRAPTTSELAELLLLKVHSVVELVDRAEAADLVKREPDPDDARVQRISLSRRGSRLLGRLAAVHRDGLRGSYRTGLTDALDELG